MKTWYVEDAGGGCRAFGEVVVLVCEETGEIYSARVPITWSNKMGWEELVCQLMINLMEQAPVTPADKLLVCSGNIFHTYHHWLTEHNYAWGTHKMDGLAHEAAESAFHQWVMEAGFPDATGLVERDYRRYYHKIEQWVFSDPERQSLIKDRQVRKKPAQPRYILKSNFHITRTCRKCRNSIQPFTPMVEQRFRADGKKHRYYFHVHCAPNKPVKSQLVKLTVLLGGQNLTGIVIPCPEETVCTICQEPLPPGTTAFYGYDRETLICGHPDCFTKATTSVS